ncbi:MAG: substrate-binding domain-containing protein [Bifidobacterium adolescentis]
MGHRRIAYAYETSNDNNQNMVFSAEARLHGLMETAEKRKMTAERIAIRNYEDATNTILNSLLTMDPAPTALYCESDELALPVSSISCASTGTPSLKSSRSSDSTTYHLPQRSA